MRYLFALLILIFISCESKPTGVDSAPGQVISNDDIQAQRIIKENCYVCHSPEASSHDVILAPPLAGVKLRYLEWFPEEEEFIKNMTSFIYQPTSDKARMMGAVAKFGVMPINSLTEEESNIVSAYIYSNILEEPTWFKAHYEEEHGTPTN